MRSSHAWAGTPATPLPCRYDARMYLGVFHVGGVVGTLNIGTGLGFPRVPVPGGT